MTPKLILILFASLITSCTRNEVTKNEQTKLVQIPDGRDITVQDTSYVFNLKSAIKLAIANAYHNGYITGANTAIDLSNSGFEGDPDKVIKKHLTADSLSLFLNGR